MTAPAALVDHIGILVEDLEEAVRRWSAATGYRFSPIGRYRTARYVDASDRVPHPHDARFALSIDGPPRVELLERTGSGTHGRARLGAHHLALVGHDDLEAVRADRVADGFAVDGENTDESGRLLLFFIDPRDLAGVGLEFVSARPGPIVWDDGTPAPRDPATGRPSVLVARKVGP